MPDTPTPPIGLLPRLLYDLFGPSYRTSSLGALAILASIMAGSARFLTGNAEKVVSGLGVALLGAMTGMGLISAKDKGTPPGSEK